MADQGADDRRTSDVAQRRIAKATYVPFKIDLEDPSSGQALEKNAFANQIRLQPGDVDAVRYAGNGNGGTGGPHLDAEEGDEAGTADEAETGGTRSARTTIDLPDEVWNALYRLENPTVPGLIPTPDVFSAAAPSELLAFGEGLLELRLAALEEVQAAALAGEPDGKETALDLVNAVANAGRAFTETVTATPIGMLHLERLEMVPAGTERGEIVASIPLAPGEETGVVQKEWSIITESFESIVTDSLEDYSEVGVTEKAELAQSSESQSKQSTSLDLSAAVSGSYGMISFTTESSLNVSQSSENSAKLSRKHAIDTTRKASTRSKKEHKVTIQTQSVSGTEVTTTRKLSNPGKHPIRIDYFSMLRKWRVRLYRYGLRLTYDMAIPEPGGALRHPYERMAALHAELARPFEFDVQPGNITDQGPTPPIGQIYYRNLEKQYGVAIAPPPPLYYEYQKGGPVPNVEKDGTWRFYQETLDVREGYEIFSVYLGALMGDFEGNANHLQVIGPGPDMGWHAQHEIDEILPFLTGKRGPQVVTYRITSCGVAAVEFRVSCQRTRQIFEQWQFDAWSTIRKAAYEHYVGRQQAIAGEIEAIRAQLEGVDTLTLRREENEELMKGMLRWLLGPAFEFMPKEVRDLFDIPGGLSGSELPIDAAGWLTMFRYQEMVKFIHAAIEWENLLYIPFGYMWDVPARWDFVRSIRHPDPRRQSFLRAGSARVVLTVRPGYEEAWISFVNNGSFGEVLPPDHPYMTIGEQIREYANTNYPGIPPANPEGDPEAELATARERGVLTGEWFEYTPTSALDIAVTTNFVQSGPPSDD